MCTSTASTRPSRRSTSAASARSKRSPRPQPGRRAEGPDPHVGGRLVAARRGRRARRPPRSVARARRRCRSSARAPGGRRRGPALRRRVARRHLVARSSVRSTRSRMLPRELLGRRMPVGVARVRGARRAAPRARGRRARASARATSASVSAGGIRMPSTPSSTRSRTPPAAGGDDAASTREGLDDHPPEPLGPRRQHEHRRVVELARRPRPGSARSWYSTCPGTSRRSSSTTCRRLPLPMITSRASGSATATRRQARASPSTFLYASSIPTKTATGRSGSGCTGSATNAERSL